MDPKKIQVIKDWKTLESVHVVRSFLGLASFYRKFVLNFSKLVAPLTELFKKSKKFKWTDKCQMRFDLLNHKLIEAPILTLLDVSRPFTIFTDAGGVAIGVVLTQDGKVVAYECRKMNEAEQRYPIYDQELLAIVHAIKICKHYLKNNDFEVATDHKPLLSFPPKGELGSRQYRWAMLFEEFTPKIIYRVGKENVVADTLSRIPQVNSISLVEGALRKEIMDAQKVDKWCQEVVQAIEIGQYVPNMSVEDGILWYNNRIVVPDITKLKYKILFELHDNPFASDVGRDKTYEAAKKYVYWKNMKKEVVDYVRTCEQCQVNKAKREHPLGLLMPLPISEGKWKSISMDFVITLPRTRHQNDQILVVVNRLTKMAFLPCRMTHKGKDIAKLLTTKIFTKYGVPKSIVSDRDSKFTSHVWKDVFKTLGTCTLVDG
eukprot:Gb_18720 [translate_table: standard]